MALVEFPEVTVVGFDHRTDDSGAVVYESAYSAADFIVGAGFSRIAGTIHLKAADETEEGLLQAFHRLLNGDDNTVFIPFDREWNGGVFPMGTVFGAAQASDTTFGEHDASSLALSYTLPSGSTASDVDLAVGSYLTVGTQQLVTCVRVTTQADTDSAVVTVIPQVTAGAAAIREAVLKVRLRASQVRLYRGQDGFMYTTGYPFREVA